MLSDPGPKPMTSEISNVFAKLAKSGPLTIRISLSLLLFSGTEHAIRHFLLFIHSNLYVGSSLRFGVLLQYTL